MRSLARWLGYGVLLLLVVVVFGVGWAFVRLVTYEQVEEEGSLARKAEMLAWMAARADPAAPRPNVVVIVFDDLGFGDLGAFGSNVLETPHIDQLAHEGVALENFYAAAPFCTPSRMGLLTGRWPVRAGLVHVAFPTGSLIDNVLRIAGRPVRMSADEITLAEALAAAGYATGMVGKWHLGDHAPSLPRDFGFSSYFGLLYSNDMDPLPLYRNEEIVEEHPIDQSSLTSRYTEEAVAWLEENADGPFFLYLAHTFPHIPLHASVEQNGQSEAGLYGDVISDLDRSTGDVLDALDRLGVADDTLVLLMSDNGPWFQGSAGDVRGRKNWIYDGGQRVPFIARWPGHIPAGVRSDGVAAAVDVFPTLAELAGVPLPKDRIIDGAGALPIWAGESLALDRPIWFYSNSTLVAVREGRYKALRRHRTPMGGPAGQILSLQFEKGPWLIDLERDPDESYDLSMKHPDELERRLDQMDDWERSLADNPRGWIR